MPRGTINRNARAASLSERAQDQGPNGDMEGIGAAHVADQEMPDPIQVLGDHRPIDANLMIEGSHRAGVGQGAEHRATDIAGQHLAAEEHHQAEDRQRDQGQRQFPRQ
jgi:hypothetical protein